MEKFSRSHVRYFEDRAAGSGMYKMSLQKIRIRQCVIYVLVAAIMMNNLINIRIGGIHITFYRTIVLLLTFYFLYINQGRLIAKRRNEIYILWMFFAWIVYALVLMMKLDSSVMRSSVKEIMAIGLGGLSIFCIVELVNDLSSFYSLIRAIKVFVLLSLVFGIFEILTGFHLPSSCFRDPIFLTEQIRMYGKVNTHLATGFQYNVNDYCTFLGFMAPAFFITEKEKNIIISLIGAGAIALMCLVDNSTICFLTVTICILWYVIRRKIYKNKYVIMLLLLIVISAGLFIIRSQSGLAGIVRKIGGKSISEEFILQYNNYRRGVGSLYKRLTIYKDSLIAAAKSRFLGIGPAAFADYFTNHPSKSKLVNPHNLWLEILTEYGLFIFSCFVLLVIKCWRSVSGIFKEKHSIIAMALMIMIIDYILISIDPSSFLGYSYQWILFALCLCLERLEAVPKSIMPAMRKGEK